MGLTKIEGGVKVGGSAPVQDQDVVPAATTKVVVASTAVPQTDAVDGAVPPHARPLFSALGETWSAGKFAEVVARLELELKALGKRRIHRQNAEVLVDWVTELYILQHRLIGTLNELSLDHPDKLAALKLLQKVGTIQTQVFERAVVLADAKDAAPVAPWMVYRNTLKSSGVHSVQELDAYFFKKLRDFVRAGGELTMIRPVTLTDLKAFPNGGLCEWVVDAWDVARMARADVSPNPGHTLLSWGNDVLAAGSMRVFKDAEGDLSEVVVGTFSGHFRADYRTLHHMVRHLVSAGVPAERIVLQGGEAGTARGLEIIYRALGRDGAQLQTKLAEVEAEAAKFNPAAPLPKKVKEKTPEPNATQVGKRADDTAKELNEAQFSLDQVVALVTQDSLVLQAHGEADQLGAAFERVLTLAELAGNPVAYERALTTLQHLSQLDDVHTDPAARAQMQALAGRWRARVFGSGTFDAADILSPRPASGARRARVIATLPIGMSAEEVRRLLMAGADVVRLDATHAALTDLQESIRQVRLAAGGLGRAAAIDIDLPSVTSIALPDTRADLGTLKALLADVDLVTLPGVCSAADIVALREEMVKLGRVVPIIAKIERQAAVEDLSHIAAQADVLLVARTELAAEFGQERVPAIERQINRAGNAYGKSTIVATEALPVVGADAGQVLRADYSSLYGAVADYGADAVLLGRETAESNVALAEIAVRAATQLICTAEGDLAQAVYRDVKDAGVPSAGSPLSVRASNRS